MWVHFMSHSVAISDKPLILHLPYIKYSSNPVSRVFVRDSITHYIIPYFPERSHGSHPQSNMVNV